MDQPIYPNIKKASTFSKSNLTGLQRTLEAGFQQRGPCVVTVGSFARGEANTHSDLDYFAIYDGEETMSARWSQDHRIIEESIKEIGLRQPSEGGAFGQATERNAIMSNIGGHFDENKNLTRRMLFLLECKCLCGTSEFSAIRQELIEKYITENITDHQLCMFLLNDIIRYWRTLCVDFENKVGDGGKSWGDRNIKLMFSRKLLYFSGILAVAETAQHHFNEKRETLHDLLSLTPVERLHKICGTNAEKALTIYDTFLERLSTEEYRTLLTNTDANREKHSAEFRKFKNDGHHFSWELSRLFSDTYDRSHPIYHAILF